MFSNCSCTLTQFFLAFALAAGLTAAQQESSMPMSMPMGTVAPLVIQSRDWDSSVTFVNESKRQAHVQLDLRRSDGTPSGSQIVTLPRHSSRRVTVASLLSSAIEDFTGSLTATVQEPDIAKNMAVAAQLTLLDKNSPNGGSIDEELEMPEMGTFKSAVSGSRALLAVQNPGMKVAPITLTCLGHNGTTRTSFGVPPNGVRFVESCKPADDAAVAPNQVLSGPRDAGASSSEEPRGFEVSSPSAEITVFGLSAGFQPGARHVRAAMFVNQNDISATSTVFAGIPIGTYAPLPGAVFKPALAIANLSKFPRHAVVKESTGGGPPNVLMTVLLKPFEVRSVEVPAPPPADSELRTIIVDQDGNPGDVVSTLADEDKVDQTVLTPVPKFLHHSQNGGGHPWSLEPGAASSVVVFNASEKPEALNLNLGADGIVWSKTVKIQPSETLNLKIKDIIDSLNAEPGRKPKITALHGEVSWFTPHQADVFGRTLIAHVDNAGRALDSYSCGDYIVLCGMNIYPSTIDIGYHSDGYLSASGESCTSYSQTGCSGSDYGPGGADSYSWQSENSNTTPISGSSTEESVELYGANMGGGGANVTGYAGICQASGGGGATVVAPDHLWVNTDTQGAINTCSSGRVGWIRKITYGIQDAHNNFLASDVGIEESFSSKSNGGVNTCTNSQVPTSQTCTSTAVSALYGDQTGFFTDTIATGCAAPVNGCGFTFTGQVWSWCSGSGEGGPPTPQALAAIGTIVATQTDITVAGTQHLTQGTVPPK